MTDLAAVRARGMMLESAGLRETFLREVARARGGDNDEH